MSNIVEKGIKDFCIWARVREIDLANAAGIDRQLISYHSRAGSKTTISYSKKTNEFEIKSGDRVFGSGKIQHVEVGE